MLVSKTYFFYGVEKGRNPSVNLISSDKGEVTRYKM